MTATLSPSTAELRRIATRIRKKFLSLHFEARSGHIGSGLSAIDILTYMYWSWLRPGDRFVLSKGHAASSLYVVLNSRGLLSDDLLKTYYRDGTTLPVHPAAGALEEIPIATGSLGHGMSICAGIAYANQHLDGNDRRVACLLSDGECNEGSVWEAALFAAHHRLRALTVLIDANGIQGFGRTREILDLEPLARKWEAFGFRVSEIDGHDFAQLHEALSRRGGGAPDRPSCVVCRTVKGKGVSFMEDRMEWHYLPMTPEEYRRACEELDVES